MDGPAARGAATPRPPRVRADFGRRRAAVPRRSRSPGTRQRSAGRVPRHVDVDPGGVPVGGVQPDQRNNEVPDAVHVDDDAAHGDHWYLRYELRAHARAQMVVRLSERAHRDGGDDRLDPGVFPPPPLARASAQARRQRPRRAARPARQRGALSVAATVVVAATRYEQPGAGMRIAGLTVVERAIKQLAQPSGAEVVVASDGSVALPPSLPGNVHVQMLDTDAGGDAVTSLAGGIGAPVVAADIVRVGRADPGTRIVDEDAVFAALYRADLGFVARRFNKPLSVRLTRHWLVGTSITPNQITLVAAAIGLVGCALIAVGGYIATVGGMLCAHVQSILD